MSTRHLSWADAENIRQRRSNGEQGMTLAAAYGVSPQTICDIVHRRRYAKPSYADLEAENEWLRERVASLMLDEPSKTQGLYAAIDELQRKEARLP